MSTGSLLNRDMPKKHIAEGFEFTHAFNNWKVRSAVHSNIHSVMVFD